MNQSPLEPQEADEPWTGPSEWFKYRCRSCAHTDWVEDIVVDSFPPAEPGGLAAIVCPKCGGRFRYDPSEPVKRSLQHPNHPF